MSKIHSFIHLFTIQRIQNPEKKVMSSVPLYESVRPSTGSTNLWTNSTKSPRCHESPSGDQPQQPTFQHHNETDGLLQTAVLELITLSSVLSAIIQ